MNPNHPLAGKVLCVDGPSASGKGTLAKALAKRYRLKYLDTGCLYRAVAWQLMQQHKTETDISAVVAAARHLDFDFKHIGNNQFGVWVAGSDVTAAIRTLEVGLLANAIARLPELRAALLDFQVSFVRHWQDKIGVVLDGRDTGKNICPHADVKILLVADVTVRAARRLLDYKAAGKDIPLEQVEAELKLRDSHDIKNLPSSADVLTIDGTQRTREEVLDVAVAHLESVLGDIPLAPAGT